VGRLTTIHDTNQKKETLAAIFEDVMIDLSGKREDVFVQVP
jgi:hypothetical protein